MYQPGPSKAPDAPQAPPIVINITEIKRVEFCYLSSTLCSKGSLGVEVTQCITKARSAFSMLIQRLGRMWDQAVDKDNSVLGSSHECTIVLLLNMDSVLLPHPAAWAVQPALLAHHLWQQWQDIMSYLQILEKCGLSSIKCLFTHSQFHWTSHEVHMEGNRILKMLLYRQLKDGCHNQGWPFKHYKGSWKQTWVTVALTSLPGRRLPKTEGYGDRYV